MVEPQYLIDPYLEWAQREGIPIVDGFGVDLLGVDTRPWARLEANGAFVHLDGRGDFLNGAVVEIPPAGTTAPQRHLFEAVAYVLDGRGSTEVETSEGTHSFEWQTASLFAIPLNVRYRLFNASGRHAARVALVTNLPILMNLFRDEGFIFGSPRDFPERWGEERYYRGEGTLLPLRPGRHMWETNFVPDPARFALQKWRERGAGGKNMMFVLADSPMHAHMSEMPVGTYKKAHRHGPDYHIFPVIGEGYSLYWYEGDADFRRFDWRHGSVFAPADRMFHQHFNVSPAPARYLAIAFGGLRYPVTASKRANYAGGMDVSVKEGGGQIEYEDEDPRIRRLYEEELRTRGVASRMSELAATRAV